MNHTDKEQAVPALSDPQKLMAFVLDKAIGMLGTGPDACSKLGLVDEFLRNGQLTPDMTERWATAKSKMAELVADKGLNDRARRRARRVLERMEKIATPSG